jgi:hypothetical protein
MICILIPFVIMSSGGSTRAAEEEGDDDLRNRIRLSFPPMAFASLLASDDEMVLTMVIETMYALAMNEDLTFSLVSFDSIIIDADAKEYTLSMSVTNLALITFHAWNALLSVVPARLRSVCVVPHYDSMSGTATMRIVARVVSSAYGHVPAYFIHLCRFDKKLLLLPWPSVVGDTAPTLQHERARAQRQVADDSRSALSRRLQALKLACRAFVDTISLPPPAPSVSGEMSDRAHTLAQHLRGYNFEQNYIGMAATEAHDVFGRSDGLGLILWSLPAGVALDVAKLYRLASDFSDIITNFTTGLRMKQRIAQSDRSATSTPPLVQINVTLHVLTVAGADRVASVTVIDSRVFTYLIEAKNDPSTVSEKRAPKRPGRKQVEKKKPPPTWNLRPTIEEEEEDDEDKLKLAVSIETSSSPHGTRDVRRRAVLAPAAAIVSSSDAADPMMLDVDMSKMVSPPRTVELVEEKVPTPGSLKRRLPAEPSDSPLLHTPPGMGDGQERASKRARIDTPQTPSAATATVASHRMATRFRQRRSEALNPAIIPDLNPHEDDEDEEEPDHGDGAAGFDPDPAPVTAPLPVPAAPASRRGWFSDFKLW